VFLRQVEVVGGVVRVRLSVRVDEPPARRPGNGRDALGGLGRAVAEANRSFRKKRELKLERFAAASGQERSTPTRSSGSLPALQEGQAVEGPVD
jgi:hypothetical protein